MYFCKNDTEVLIRIALNMQAALGDTDIFTIITLLICDMDVFSLVGIFLNFSSVL
jgi:hypothetical protein